MASETFFAILSKIICAVNKDLIVKGLGSEVFIY